MTKGIYEIVNPSDPITVRATPIEAAVLAKTLALSFLFLKPVEGRGDPIKELTGDEWRDERNAIWADPERLASYAEMYRSALIGSVTERLLFEDAVGRMSPDDAKVFAANWHELRRSSMNDICGQLWNAAEQMKEGAK